MGQKIFDAQKYWETRWENNISHDTASLNKLYAEVAAGPPFSTKNHQIRAGHLEWLRTGLSPFAVSGCSLLDAGCGPGFWFPLWAELGFRTRAVDRTARGVSDARARSVSLNLDIPITLAELSGLPYEDKSFDVAVTVMVLLHTPPQEIQQTIRELGRVAKALLLLEHVYPPQAKLSPHVFNHNYRDLAVELGYEIVSELQRPMEFGHESLFLMRTSNLTTTS